MRNQSFDKIRSLIWHCFKKTGVFIARISGSRRRPFVIFSLSQTLCCVTGIRTSGTTVFAGQELQTDGDGTSESIQLHEPHSICKFLFKLVIFV
jgi:hypothetical protein